jgi:hypothetical protein
MASGTTVAVSCSKRDGSTLEVIGAIGNSLAAQLGYTYTLKYKIGDAGSYQTIVQRTLPSNSSESNISLESWTYKFNVETDDIVYLQLIVTTEFSQDYTGTSQAINSVSYNKSKTSRASKSKKNIATANPTRREYPSF